VLATQCILQRRPKTLAIEVSGRLQEGVTAKDLILAIIGQIGVSGGTGHVIEYRGSAIEALSMDERMTVCNMSIEAGARAGMVAPDETTYRYLKGRRFSPQGAEWDKAVARWEGLRTDPGAKFDRVVELDANTLEPMITYGTHPGMVVPISGTVPNPLNDAVHAKSLAYMGLTGGERLEGKPIQVVFIGSCTNARLSDLELAARVLKGRKIARGVRALVVPGSQQVKREAEANGLAKIFVDAGAEWRESGCSMCIGMNGDVVAKGEYAVSTSNRNFEGRQGTGSRTLLASPATAAAAAITGKVTDPRPFLSELKSVVHS
jgi:3-isopropylmalate/(R)-2-methylmalate dehydratase large subunit